MLDYICICGYKFVREDLNLEMGGLNEKIIVCESCGRDYAVKYDMKLDSFMFEEI